MKPSAWKVCEKCGKRMRRTATGNRCRACLMASGQWGRGAGRKQWAICRNPRCRRRFLCPQDKDPRYAYCRACLDSVNNWACANDLTYGWGWGETK